MFEAVHARPEGPTTVSRWLRTAAEYGYDGVVVRNHGDEGAPTDLAAFAGPPTSDAPGGESANDVGLDGSADVPDLDVVRGVEVRAEDPGRAGGFVGSHREETTIVLVHGGTERINRFAVEHPAVDVLAHPMRTEDAFNHVLARAAVENGVRVELSLRQILTCRGGERVRAIRRLRKLGELVAQYDVPVVVSADPRSHLELRAPRELRALGEIVGVDPDLVDEGLREWGRLAARNRDRHSDRFVEPGVWRVEGEDDPT